MKAHLFRSAALSLAVSGILAACATSTSAPVASAAAAGDCDAAFEHLDRALDARDPALVHLAVAPQWDSLRGDPRFNQRLARMRLQPVS